MSNLFSKPVLITAAAGFVTFSVYGYLVHGILLADIYAAMPQEPWRAEGEELMAWIFIAYALMAWMMAVLRPEGLTSAMTGLERGALLGVFLGSVNFIFYALQPWTLEATIAGFLADVVMIALGGAVIATVAGKLADSAAQSAPPPTPPM